MLQCRATFCPVDQDCQLIWENGVDIPTLLIRINKKEPRINKVWSQINEVGHRIVEGVDLNHQRITKEGHASYTESPEKVLGNS